MMGGTRVICAYPRNVLDEFAQQNKLDEVLHKTQLPVGLRVARVQLQGQIQRDLRDLRSVREVSMCDDQQLCLVNPRISSPNFRTSCPNSWSLT